MLVGMWRSRHDRKRVGKEEVVKRKLLLHLEYCQQLVSTLDGSSYLFAQIQI